MMISGFTVWESVAIYFLCACKSPNFGSIPFLIHGHQKFNSSDYQYTSIEKSVTKYFCSRDIGNLTSAVKRFENILLYDNHGFTLFR